MSDAGPLSLGFVRGVLSRDGPNVAAVREALAGIDDPREAWELLDARGMTPPASAPWLSWTPRTCEFCRGLGQYWRFVALLDGGDDVTCASCKGLTVDAPEPVPVPDSMPLVTALAGDPEGVARCTLLAVEAWSRLAAWSDRPVAAPRVVWRTASRLLAWGEGPENVSWTRGRRRFEHVTSRVRAAVERALTSRAWREARRVLVPLREVAETRWPLTAEILEAAFWWSRCPGASITPTSPCRFVGRPLDALVDPFAPMLEVLSHGHAFDAFTDDAVILVASPLAAADVAALRGGAVS